MKLSDVLKMPVNSCPYTEWYKFRRCCVRTCKNFTEKTRTRCLGIDRVVPEGNKLFSDAELNLYKFNTQISTRYVSIKRKRAIERTKMLLTLHKFIDHLEHNRSLSRKPISSEQLTELENRLPLKISKLHFKNWMWPHLTNPDVWKKFVHTKNGECKEFHVHRLLYLTAEKYSALTEHIKNLNEKE